MDGEEVATSGVEKPNEWRVSAPHRERRELGRDAGTFVVPADSDGPLPEDILRAVEA